MSQFDRLIADRFAEAVRSRDDMHDYQREDVEFFKSHPFSFGMQDLGLGKTVTAATVLADLLAESFPGGKALIVGPIAVISSSWPDEFRAWRHLSWMSYTVLREDDADPRIAAARKVARQQARAGGASPAEQNKAGGAAETAERRRIRDELARNDAAIHLVNFEALEWLVELHGRRWPYRWVIIDESSMLKSHTSARYKALVRVRNTDGLITRLHNLGASPVAEGYEGLFTQTYLLDRGERFSKFVTHFREEFFIEDRWSMKRKLRTGAEEQILAKIADISTIRKRADHFDVREPLVLQRRVHMTSTEADLYEQLMRESVVTLSDGTEIEAGNAAALSQKLSQLASGVLYETRLEEGQDEDDDLVKVLRVHAIHDHKIEMLRAIVEEMHGENLLVSYQHKSSLDRLVKAFPKAVKWDKTGKSKAPWNAGKIPMLLMHPKSGGHGNNLQQGGCTVVFFDIPWSREQYTQLIGRVDRQGQTKPVTVIQLITAGTIDERIAQTQRDKGNVEQEMVSILKRLIRQYRSTSC